MAADAATPAPASKMHAKKAGKGAKHKVAHKKSKKHSKAAA